MHCPLYSALYSLLSALKAHTCSGTTNCKPLLARHWWCCHFSSSLCVVTNTALCAVKTLASSCHATYPAALLHERWLLLPHYALDHRAKG